ncbi:expressed protein [Chlorella variabilis]|uniref:Expressed protein n=1 Tax=Chlorella variabilis TaxID=554065 RepID=E1ZNJ8_CHLVA|nr:expressed protein [Chlorella variabilis]EFN52695.1 expressed protein [Chlorella variabilis]|eukprot:XP_005844797.1 expressed protein [Chlorella variabilis]
MSTEHPESTQPTADTQERGVQAHQSGQQHGAGSSSSAALLNAAASAFVPPAAAGPAIAASAAESSPAGPVAAAHGRPAQGGRGGGGGRGRGRGGSLSRELQGAGGHAGPRPRDLQLGSGRGSGGGARGGARQYFGSAPAGSGAGPRQQAGEGVLGSSPGRRGVAANHLLAFQTRRDSERQAAACGRGGGGRGARGGGPPRRPAPKPQPYDRNKFLQANFRFLVSDALDVRRFEADPDLMLEWEDVAQVEMLSAAPVRCPITLEERPFCPQITPCGHVFSFPAIIGHLVAHGGPELRKSAPCPLCYTQARAPPPGPRPSLLPTSHASGHRIAARELRLVQVHQVAAPAVGQVATFQLLRRPRDSINPEAVAAPGQRCERAGAAPADGTTAAGSPGKDEARPVGAPPAPAEAGGGASACNRFSKFTLVGGAAATALWVAEARRLAAYAAQVTAEGGAEAAYEAPNIYSAIDALAARARAAAERRQRTLLEAADPMVQDSLLSPEEAGPPPQNSSSTSPQTASGSSCAPSTSACCWPTTAPTPPARPPSLRGCWRWRMWLRTRPAGGACACWPTCPSPPPSSCAKST